MELRGQQIKLGQLEKYLPTLQLKKAMLQLEINQCLNELERLQLALKDYESKIGDYAQLYTDKDAQTLIKSAKLKYVNKHFENIAGVEIPVFEEVIYEEISYDLFDTPYWMESGVSDLRKLIEYR